MQTAHKDIVSAIRSIEPFPHVATRVLEMAGRADVVPNELTDVIQTDPGITAKVLKLCNSAYYGFQREIASMHEAGNLLGSTTLVNLVLTSSASRYFREYGETSRETQEQQWKTSVANALSSRLLAELQGDVDLNRAYTAGLLQNIGHIVLERYLQREKPAVLALVASGSGLLAAEREVLGLDHAEIGARLATRWSFPSVLVDTIRHHHAPECATVDKKLAATVHLAETLSWAVGLGAGVDDITYDVAPEALALAGLVAEDLPGMEGALAQELERAKDFLAA